MIQLENYRAYFIRVIERLGDDRASTNEAILPSISSGYYSYPVCATLEEKY
jgi:hypothetical protein